MCDSIHVNVCPECGKEFVMYVDSRSWVYHQYCYVEYPPVCSWKCARSSEKRMLEEEKKNRKRKRFSKKVDDIIIELDDYMEYAYLTVKDVADLTGIPPCSIYQWRCGICKPNIDNRKVIEEFLNENWRCKK